MKRTSVVGIVFSMVAWMDRGSRVLTGMRIDWDVLWNYGRMSLQQVLHLFQHSPRGGPPHVAHNPVLFAEPRPGDCERRAGWVEVEAEREGIVGSLVACVLEYGRGFG